MAGDATATSAVQWSRARLARERLLAAVSVPQDVARTCIRRRREETAGPECSSPRCQPTIAASTASIRLPQPVPPRPRPAAPAQLDVGGRHQPHLLTQPPHLARPMARSGTDPHAGQARRQDREGLHFRPAPSASAAPAALGTYPTDPAGVPGRREADGRDSHGGRLLPFRGPAPTASSLAQQRHEAGTVRPSMVLIQSGGRISHRSI